MKTNYYPRPNKDQPRRESVIDRWLTVLDWKQKHPEHERLTPYAVEIIRKEREEKTNKS